MLISMKDSGPQPSLTGWQAAKHPKSVGQAYRNGPVFFVIQNLQNYVLNEAFFVNESLSAVFGKNIHRMCVCLSV